MRYEQALVGKRVRARGDRSTPGFRGVVGSVLRCYGEPEYLAVEVVDKDGRSRVFWHHEVEEVEARKVDTRPNPARPRPQGGSTLPAGVIGTGARER